MPRDRLHDLEASSRHGDMQLHFMLVRIFNVSRKLQRQYNVCVYV